MSARGYSGILCWRYHDASARTAWNQRLKMPWRWMETWRNGTRKQLSSAISCGGGAPGRCGKELAKPEKTGYFKGGPLSILKVDVRRVTLEYAVLGTIAGDSESYRAQT